MKTTDLKTNTWIKWNGSLAKVVGKRPSGLREGMVTVTLDRFNACGTKVATAQLDVPPGATWSVAPRPSAYGMKF